MGGQVCQVRKADVGNQAFWALTDHEDLQDLEALLALKESQVQWEQSASQDHEVGCVSNGNNGCYLHGQKWGCIRLSSTQSRPKLVVPMNSNGSALSKTDTGFCSPLSLLSYNLVGL